MQRFFIKLVTTFFFIGYLPLIPGTFGSVAALLIYINLAGKPYFLIPIHFLIMILGFLLTGRAVELFNRQDPPQIVIDEINGMLISFLGLPIAQLGEPLDKLILIAGFVIFRILDVVKPYPANRFQRLRGNLGIMSDDIICGIYTNLILHLILAF